MSGVLTTEVIASEGALAALATDWWALCRRVPSASPFQSPAWLLPWWRHFHPGELATIAVRSDRLLIGLATFYIEVAEQGPRLLPLGISVSDYLDVLLDPSLEQAAGAALTSAALDLGGAWQRWELEELPPGAAARRLVCPIACREERCEQSICPVLALPDAVAGLRALASRSKWRHLQLARNRSDRAGGFTIRQVSGNDVGSFLAELARLHAARWQSRGEAGVMADDRILPFHREAAVGFDDAGIGRFYLGLLAGTPVAALYGLACRGSFMGYLSGFDPTHEHESPGSLLLLHVLESAIGERIREFHFLRGRETYKYEWNPTERVNIKRSFIRHG
jgi:CelD/BcsL family acetyltransferase involved in cellulose biosynthesis